MTLCALPVQLRGASWAVEDSIIAESAGPLVRVPAGGGEPVEITKLQKDERTHRFPQYLPEHQVVVMTAARESTDYDDATVEAVSLKTGARKLLVNRAHGGRYVPSGHLLYEQNGTIYAARFDVERLELKSSAVPVLEDIRFVGAGAASIAFTPRGLAVLGVGVSEYGTARRAVWSDSSGKEEEAGMEPGPMMTPRFSPDGRNLAYTVEVRREAVAYDIWVRDLERRTSTRLTFTPGSNILPVWTPDGKAIVYRNQGAKTGLNWIPADGSGQAQPLDLAMTPWGFSPDGKVLVGIGGRLPSQILIAPVEGDAQHPRLGTAQVFAAGATDSGEPAISPDGRWIAYSSLDSGRLEVYVRPFPNGGGKWQISNGAGRLPHWSAQTRELVYEAREGIMAVGYTVSGNSFVAGKPRVWASGRFGIGGPATRYMWDLSPDGKRILSFQSSQPEGPEQSGERQLLFLVNFFDELRRRVK
jgi:serine/threonine-protein kinase